MVSYCHRPLATIHIDLSYYHHLWWQYSKIYPIKGENQNTQRRVNRGLQSCSIPSKVTSEATLQQLQCECMQIIYQQLIGHLGMVELCDNMHNSTKSTKSTQCQQEQSHIKSVISSQIMSCHYGDLSILLSLTHLAKLNFFFSSLSSYQRQQRISR